MARNIYILLK